MAVHISFFSHTNSKTNTSVNDFIAKRIDNPQYQDSAFTTQQENLLIEQEQQIFAEGKVLRANPLGGTTEVQPSNYYLMAFYNSANNAPLPKGTVAGMHIHPLAKKDNSEEEFNRRLIMFPPFDSEATNGSGSNFFILSEDPIDLQKTTAGKLKDSKQFIDSQTFIITDNGKTLYAYEVPNGVAVEVIIDTGTTHQFIHYDKQQGLLPVVAVSHHPHEYYELERAGFREGNMQGQTKFSEGITDDSDPSIEGTLDGTARITALLKVCEKEYN